MGLMDKAGDALNSDKGEQLSDKGIQAGSDAANKTTGGKFADQIDKGGRLADDHVGQDENPTPGTEGDPPVGG